MIEHWTDIEMKKTKRNRRKQKLHLAGARAIQDINDPDGEWRGRPVGSVMTLDNSKVAERVRGWMLSHPDSHNKSACARDLGLTRPTVIKWWRQIQEQSEEYLHEKEDNQIVTDIMDGIYMGAGHFDDEELTLNFD